MSDLSGVVNEQKATIETLRRRVAELEEERDTANKYLDEVLDRGDKVLGERDALTAENAELKRQVEALREDAEIGRLVKAASKSHDDFGICTDEEGVDIYHEPYDQGLAVNKYTVLGKGPTVLEALRGAAKGGVEG